MRITVSQLKKLKACPGQVARFKRHFPRGVTVTEAKCVKYARSFDWGWTAHRFLSPTDWESYRIAEFDARCFPYSSNAYKLVVAAAFGRLAERK